MTRLFQRLLASALLSISMVAATVGASYGQDKVVRIGFQKYGKLVLLKSKGTLEEKLKAAGYKVVWTEFPSGPPLLEALNVGAIDFGNTGEAPPIFAQAAGAPIQYVAYEPPAPKGEAILVPKDSKLTSVADLKGKKVALNKGSNVHYLLVKALEKAGVKYSEIEPVFLAPADARAAFERGAVDAWVIWDPFQAAAEAATGARSRRVRPTQPVHPPRPVVAARPVQPRRRGALPCGSSRPTGAAAPTPVARMRRRPRHHCRRARPALPRRALPHRRDGQRPVHGALAAGHPQAAPPTRRLAIGPPPGHDPTDTLRRTPDVTDPVGRPCRPRSRQRGGPGPWPGRRR